MPIVRSAEMGKTFCEKARLQHSAAQERPAAPGAVGRQHLIVHGLVGADTEERQIAIGIKSGTKRQDRAPQARPVGPLAVGRLRSIVGDLAILGRVRGECNSQAGVKRCDVLRLRGLARDPQPRDFCSAR
jgi:hypothetical protein